MLGLFASSKLLNRVRIYMRTLRDGLLNKGTYLGLEMRLPFRMETRICHSRLDRKSGR